MRPYGLPRDPNIEWPDVGDIQYYGLKSSAGRCPTNVGYYKSYTRNASRRRATRRVFKKLERNRAKRLVTKDLVEMQKGDTEE